MSALSTNTAAAQRSQIKAHFRNHSRLTTLQARSELDVMHPAGRIQEPREKGEPIITNWRIDYTPEGKPHRVAEYVLITGEKQTPAATGAQGNVIKLRNI